MPTAATIAKIETYWAWDLGCEVNDLRVPGITVRSHAMDYRGAVLFRRNNSCIISVPPEMQAAVATEVASLELEELFNTATLENLFGEHAANILGPARIAYADQSDLLMPPSRDGRILRTEQAAFVQRFVEKLLPDEWEEAGRLDSTVNPLVGIFKDDVELAALAGYRANSQRSIADIFVVTRADMRCKGYGKAAVALLSHYGIQAGLIMQYRARETNHRSLLLAKAIGFQPFARNIAVRFRNNARS